jgi:putative tryptophan/tyrosine transport system substrate-binding protein
VRRREFIAGLGSAVAWPPAARTQQGAVPVIGFLNGSSSKVGSEFLAAFRQGLREERFIEGENEVFLKGIRLMSLLGVCFPRRA